MSHESGVYEILNTVNGKRYIGSAVNFEKRWALHCTELKKGIHHSSKLQRAWDKYGEIAFTFNQVMLCARSDLIAWEQFCLDEFGPEYNICKIAGSPLGVKRSAETRAKLSKAKRGKKQLPETTAKIAESNRGQRRSEETKQRISNSLKGKPGCVGYIHTPETKLKMSAWQIGRVMSSDARANISLAHMGVPWSPARREADNKRKELRSAGLLRAYDGSKGIPWSEARREADNKRKELLAAGLLTMPSKGKPFSPEHCLNISAAHLGKPWSPARRAAFNKKKEAK